MILFLQRKPENDGIFNQSYYEYFFAVRIKIVFKNVRKVRLKGLKWIINDFFFNTALSAQLSCLAGLSLSLSKMGLCTLYSVQCTDCYENVLQFSRLA